MIFIIGAHELNIESQRNFVLEELQKFGLQINSEKSCLTPSQKVKFIGFVIETNANENSVHLTISKDRISKVKRDIKRALKHGHVSARFLARIAGQLVSMTKAIIPTKLFLRNVIYIAFSHKSPAGKILFT